MIHEALILAIVLLPAWIWLTTGFVYLTRDAEILAVPRIGFLHLLKRTPRLQAWIVKLISCAECLSFWWAMIAFAILWPIPYDVLALDPWTWWLTPAAGICGVGMTHHTMLASPRDGARVLVKQASKFLAPGNETTPLPRTKDRDR